MRSRIKSGMTNRKLSASQHKIKIENENQMLRLLKARLNTLQAKHEHTINKQYNREIIWLQ